VPPPPILFDLDGTLADTLGDIAASTNHVRALQGLPPLPQDRVRACIGHGALRLLQSALAELAMPAGDPRWQDLLAAYGEHHEAQCTKTAALYPGVAQGLLRLRSRGHPLAVVTNKPERFAKTLVAALDLGPLLPVVIGGDTLPHRKPDPAPLVLALERLGIPAGPLRAAAVMVGDGETDIRAGQALSLRTVACLYGYRDEAALLALFPDVRWRRFLESDL
jgi:phosphoglycolate phosphatase